MSRCFECQVALTRENSSKEHIFPNAIGGRLRARLLCKKCNTEVFGSRLDARFAEVMRPFSTLLRVKRHRSGNQPFEASLTSGGRVVVDDEMNLKFKRSGPAILASGINVEGAQACVRIGFDFGALEVRQMALKVALEFYLLCGGVRESVESRILELRQGGEPQSVVFFDPFLPIVFRKETEPTHHVSIVGGADGGLLYGIVDFFGAVRFLVLLNDKYSGPAIRRSYVVNPRTGIRLKPKVNAVIARADVENIFRDRPDFSKQTGELIERTFKMAISSQLFGKFVAGRVSEIVNKHRADARENEQEVTVNDLVSGIISDFTERLMLNVRAATERRHRDAEAEFTFKGGTTWHDDVDDREEP